MIAKCLVCMHCVAPPTQLTPFNPFLLTIALIKVSTPMSDPVTTQGGRVSGGGFVWSHALQGAVSEQWVVGCVSAVLTTPPTYG